MELDTVICGDCLDILPTLPDASVDAFITDPPYPHIKRDYGYWTTEEWWALIVEGMIPQVRRILKPTGSAVFILQPNYERVGSMRGWLFEFQSLICREWNMVQDAWWWNPAAMPNGGSTHAGILRSSVKACVWAGPPDCYKNQDAVLWSESQSNALARATRRIERRQFPSGNQKTERIYQAAVKRGGVTPYNMLPIANTNSQSSAGASGHGAGTPLKLADWWVRYIVPHGGVVCDPFFGVGTMGVAAVQNGCRIIGIDKEPGYIETARERVAEARREYIRTQQEASQMEMAWT